jgi:aspartate/methionine/tyrosine aminotransferase
MEALMMATQALVEPGDRTVVMTPVWPNVVEIPKILGAQVVTVPLSYDRARWSLDVDRLLDAVTPDTRILYLNSPNNPTGWTIDAPTRDAVLDHCRKLGVWLIQDDAYERLYYREPAPAAPTFLDVAAPEDRVISANTFSKAWMMTGWRLGWMITPDALVPSLGKLIEFNTSCAPMFVQKAGVAAITQGEPAVAHTVRRFRRARDLLLSHLARIPGIEVAVPDGTMYAFIRISGVEDSVAFCQKLVATVGLGLAPGSAFGREGEGFVRWCFAAAESKLADGVERLRRGLTEHRAHA